MIDKLARAWTLLKDLVMTQYCGAFRMSRTFVFKNEEYSYFFGRYNGTWRNERAVEIPIIKGIIGDTIVDRAVKNQDFPCVLEIGNVLSHYGQVSHDVVDKYEKADGVFNEDIIDFEPKKKYDLIVSISTLEHVGWDEPVRDPDAVIYAWVQIRSLLASGGRAVVTIPLGFNPVLDYFIEEKKIVFDELYFMKRVSKSNEWIEVKADGAWGARYGTPYCNANVLLIGIMNG